MPTPDLQEDPQDPRVQADPLRQYGADLKTFIYEHILNRIDYSRQTQLLLALRNELFWRAKQFLRFQFNDNGMTVIPATGVPGSPGVNLGQGIPEPQSLSYVFNITRGDGQKFVAVVGARVPYVTFEPKDAQSAESMKNTRDAKAIGRYLDEIWNIDEQHKDLARTLFRSGPQFGHICWVTDGEKYGFETIEDTQLEDVDEPPQIACDDCGEMSPHSGGVAANCPQCGSASTSIVPGQKYQVPSTTTRQAPRGMPELHPYSIFEVAIPPERKTIEACEWLDCCLLQNSGKLKSLYGDLVAGISDTSPSADGTSAQATAGEAHDLIASADAIRSTRLDEWWWRRLWLTPDMYHHAPTGLKEVLQKQYPKGVRLVFINDQYIQAVEEKHTDVWVVCKTGTDDRILGDPICHDLIPINQIINDFYNLAIETMLRAIPKTIVDPRLVDRQAIQNNAANVAEIIFANPGLGANLGSMVAELPIAKFSEQMMPLAESFRAISRELDGVQEAIFGGGEPAPTWRQDQQKRNAALAQFLIAYDQMRAYRRDVFKKALNLLKKYGTGTVTVPSDSLFGLEPTTVDFQSFDPDQVVIETEETLPQSRAEEVDELREQFALPPQIQEMIGLFHPVNAPRITSMLALHGMHSTYSDITLKSINIIRQLLKAEPIPDPTAPPPPPPIPGEPPAPPPPMVSSITPDPFEFKNAAFAVEVFRCFCNDPESGQLELANNPKGYQNVKLFGMALDKMATPPLPPPPVPKPTLNITASADKMAPNQFEAIVKDFGMPLPPPIGTPPSIIAATLPKPSPMPPPGGTVPAAPQQLA